MHGLILKRLDSDLKVDNNIPYLYDASVTFENIVSWNF